MQETYQRSQNAFPIIHFSYRNLTRTVRLTTILQAMPLNNLAEHQKISYFLILSITMVFLFGYSDSDNSKSEYMNDKRLGTFWMLVAPGRGCALVAVLAVWGGALNLNCLENISPSRCVRLEIIYEYRKVLSATTYTVECSNECRDLPFHSSLRCSLTVVPILIVRRLMLTVILSNALLWVIWQAAQKVEQTDAKCISNRGIELLTFVCHWSA